MSQAHKHPTGLADLYKVLATQTLEQAKHSLPGLLDLLGLELKYPEIPKQEEEKTESHFDSFTAPTSKTLAPEKVHELKSIELQRDDGKGQLLKIFPLIQKPDQKIGDKITSQLLEAQSEFQYKIFTLHSEQLKPGAGFESLINTEITHSDIVLFMTTAHQSAIRFINKELARVKAQKIPIVPVWLNEREYFRDEIPELKEYSWLSNSKAAENLSTKELTEFVQVISNAINKIGRELFTQPELSGIPPLPQTSTYQPEPYIGLNPNQLRAYLTRHLSNSKPGFELNLAELEKRFVTQTPLFPVPYQQERSFSHQFRIVIDMSATLRLFDQDIRLFITALRKLLPNESIEIFQAFSVDDKLLVQNRKGEWNAPQNQTSILIFSLFGFNYNWQGFDAPQIKLWQNWLAPMHRQGISVNAITPFSTRFLASSPLNWINAIDWHSHSYNDAFQKASTSSFNFTNSKAQRSFLSWSAQMGEQVFLLAQLLSMTVTCSLSLLRYLQKQLCPHARVYHELQLFQCFQFDYLSSDNIKLNDQHANWLRDSFRHLLPEKYLKAKALIKAWREQQQASVLLVNEEKWLHPHLLEDSDYKDAEQLALQMLSAMEQDTNREQSLGSWLVRARKTMPEVIKHQRYMDNCFIKSQLRRGATIERDSLSRPHNRWLMKDNFTAKISFHWVNNEFAVWLWDGTDKGHPYRDNELVTMQFRMGDPPVINIKQQSLFRTDLTLTRNLTQHNPNITQKLSSNFPVQLSDLSENQLLIFPSVNVFIFCNTEDAGYAHALADMWRLTNVNCVVMCNQFWHESSLQLSQLQETFPDSLFIGLVDKIFLNAPTSYLFGFKADLEFFNYFLFTSEKYSEFNSEVEQGYLNLLGDPQDRLLMPHESLDDLTEEERNQFLVEFALQIEQKINAGINQRHNNSTVIEVRNALEQSKALTGEFVAIVEKGDDHPPELIVEYEDVKVLITASEMGLKPVPDLNAFRSGDPLFIPVSESAPDEETQFYGSIRLAQLGLPSVIKWFEDSPRGTTVSGRLLPDAAYSLARTDDAIFVELEVLVAEMSPHDRFNNRFPPGSTGDSESDFKILSTDPKTGHVRVGQKQLSINFQNQLRNFLTEQERFEASVLQEYADGVDVQFGEGLSGFIPNKELFWGATESLGWMMQTLLTGRTELQVKCIDDGEYSLPILSAKIEASFKDVTKQYTPAQSIHIEDMLTSQGDSLYSLHRNILVEIPIENIPYRYRANSELLQEFEMSPPEEEFEIADIDEVRELLQLSCFEQERQKLDKVKEFLEPGTVVYGKVLSRLENSILIELTDIGTSPAGIADVPANPKEFQIGTEVRGITTGFDDDLLLVKLDNITG